MIKKYVDEALTNPLKQVAREMVALYAFAAIGVLIGAASAVIYVGNRILPKKD